MVRYCAVTLPWLSAAHSTQVPHRSQVRTVQDRRSQMQGPVRQRLFVEHRKREEQK